MSLLDRITDAVMPTETAEERAAGRTVARSVAADGDWLSMVIEHHERIEALFEAALAAAPSSEEPLPGETVSRDAPAMPQLSAGPAAPLAELQTLLTAHAQAEETVIYPAMADSDAKDSAMKAYNEQATTKIGLGLLEKLAPGSAEWREKLTTIRDAVLHHAYEEEARWFPHLQQHLLTEERARLNTRFAEEFTRYAGTGGSDPAAPGIPAF